MKVEVVSPSPHQNVAEDIRVRGTVQGVGFRPTVYRLAKGLGLRGQVSNDGQGLLIRVMGDRSAIEALVKRLKTEAPPLAHIETIYRSPYQGNRTYSDFTIASSNHSIVRTQIAPDAATCPACKQEIFDPFSRWYRYPFTNCTHCGPRLSLLHKLPYDRGHTSMAAFDLCSNCQQDYNEPLNRRFHAQATACPVCGPKAWLERADGKSFSTCLFSMLDDVDAVWTPIQQGEIVAIKGLGGFHLACDATNEDAVQRLRASKHRPDKPLALMARDTNIIQQYCTITPVERELLESSAAPIVLLQAKGRKQVAPSVAPGQNTLGFMLPYTPLHHLLMSRQLDPIILTSGNLSEEPQCTDNEEARSRLGGIASYFLMSDREIVNRLDDSVVRVLGDRPQILRRARGYAPDPIDLPEGFKKAPPLLAMGSQLKNTFCLLREGQAILSQQIGNLENSLALADYRQALNLYLGLLEQQPRAIAVDGHPEYLSTQLGKELAAAGALPLHIIQHHHAHVAACMAENGLPLDTPPILGIALDGWGYGEDGTLWGGEFLLADYRHFKRLATFKPVPTIGGEQAIYQPWRNTYAHLRLAFGDLTNIQEGYLPGDRQTELLEFLRQKPLKLLDRMVAKGINAPRVSSCGRLFDAVAAAIGVCREACSYEGQGAMALESLAERYLFNHPEETEGYLFRFGKLKGEGLPYIEPRPMWQELLEDLKQNTPNSEIAAKFHQGLAETISSTVLQLRRRVQIDQVALTGSVFQNKILLEGVRDRLNANNIQVLTHRQVPANDGGISLGQAAIAAAQMRSSPVEYL